MDPSLLEAALTPRTKATMPVHLYGQVMPMDSVVAFAREHELVIVEDACQAHGARWKGRRAGTFGDVGCFSFYPGKNLGAYGDGGAIVTADAAIAERLCQWRRGASFTAIRSPWLERTAGRGEEIRVRLADRELIGIFDTIDESGRLLLRYAGGTVEAIAAGEVFPIHGISAHTAGRAHRRGQESARLDNGFPER